MTLPAIELKSNSAPGSSAVYSRGHHMNVKGHCVLRGVLIDTRYFMGPSNTDLNDTILNGTYKHMPQAL